MFVVTTLCIVIKVSSESQEGLLSDSEITDLLQTASLLHDSLTSHTAIEHQEIALPSPVRVVKESQTQQQCVSDGTWYDCESAACTLEHVCEANTGLRGCACPPEWSPFQAAESTELSPFNPPPAAATDGANADWEPSPLQMEESTMPLSPPPPPATDGACNDATIADGVWMRHGMKLKAGPGGSRVTKRTPYMPKKEIDVAMRCPYIQNRNCLAENPAERERMEIFFSWDWQPNTCDLLPFEAPRMAGLLHDRRVLFIGDRSSEDMAISLRCMLHSPADTNAVHVFDSGVGGIHSESLAQFNCPGAGCQPSQIVDVWRQILTRHNMRDKDIIILSTDHSMGRLTVSFANVLGETLTDVFQGKVIFRTSIARHPRCMQNSADLYEPSGDDEMRSLSHRVLKKEVVKYWDQKANADRLIHTEFQRILGARYSLLNISMFEHRVDGHLGNLGDGDFDCLNYCLPGPTRMWNQLLYNNLFIW
jgi:hypothetical protein